MTNLLNKLKQFIQLQEQNMTNSVQNPPDSSENQADSTDDTAVLNATIVKNLMDMLDRTQEGMYSCEETFDLLDEYVELIDDNEEAAALMPYVKRHLDRCPDCHGIYATLLNILQSEPSST